MHGGEHHEIDDGGWLMMTMATDSPLRTPEWSPHQPSRESLGLGGSFASVKRDESFSLIFSPCTRIYGVGIEVGGGPESPQAYRARPQGLWPLGGLPLDNYCASIFYIFQK